MNFINKITNYFKELFNTFEKEEKIEKLNELIININIGDIINAKRYATDEELNNISDNHQNGPFIVLGKCEKGLICSYGTSKEPNKKYIDNYFKINSDFYNLKKDTYFKLSDYHIIDNYSFLNTIDILNKKDLDSIMYKLKINKKIFCNKENKKYKLDIYLQNGDVINYNNNNYIVLDILENKILCIPFYFSAFDINYNNLKKLNFNKLSDIDKDVNYDYLTTLDDYLYSLLLQLEKNFFEKIKQKEIPQRGNVINKDDELYYIYGEMGSDILVFNIKKNFKDGYKTIIINSKKYFTIFKSEIINKDSEFEIITKATEKEITTIRNIKKVFTSENNKKKINKRKSSKLYVGDIVNHRYIDDERFIIIGKNNDFYFCLSISKLIQGIIETILIKKDVIEISEDQSVEGLIWLENRPNFNMYSFNNRLDEIIDTQQKYLNEKTLKRTL